MAAEQTINLADREVEVLQTRSIPEGLAAMLAFDPDQDSRSNLMNMIKAYEKAGGTLPTDWETVYYCNNGRLEWLEYNIKRALGMECSEEEIELGVGQVKETIAHVIYYHEAKDRILESLKKM